MRVLKKSGFTLVEVVIVMAIIAILAVLILGAIQIARKTQNQTVLLNDAKTMQNALEQYYARKKDFPPAPYQTAYTDNSVRDRNAYALVSNDDYEMPAGTKQNVLNELMKDPANPPVNPGKGGAVCYNRASSTTYYLWVVNKDREDQIMSGSTSCTSEKYASGSVCPCGRGQLTDDFSAR